tara:strand:- start:759 stop:2036 length:1278 start_codon:yes stop_codon:yes gene_type:complete
MHHVIVGSGPAGVVAAETLRTHQKDARVTILNNEDAPPYSRMAIPYYLIDQIEENGTHLRKNKDHFSSIGIDLINGELSTIDLASKTLLLNDSTNKSLQYDKLLLATGSSPNIPKIQGIETEGVSSCWTLADARYLLNKIRKGDDVVLMGAGFIGCIILEALVKSGANLTVVEMEDRMVPRMMNDDAGGMIKDWCLSKGVVIHTGTRVEEIEKLNSGKLVLKLSDGKMLEANLAVSATGVSPNTGFLKKEQLKVGQGILVNRSMQTSDPDVFAAGDVAEGLDFSTGEYSIQAIQPTAVDHARVAAKNMIQLGSVEHQGSINMNVLDTLGLISCSFGAWAGMKDGEQVSLINKDRFKYFNLQFEDDLLVGATSIGMTQHVGVLRGLIQSRIRLGDWKDRLLKDPTRLMEAYLSSTQALGFNSKVFA